MNTDHFDIGTIQAFLDGELAHDRVAEVSSHVGACDDCALMLAQAEDESAIVFPALES
jgi:anti-sigma factor RsiW